MNCMHWKYFPGLSVTESVIDKFNYLPICNAQPNKYSCLTADLTD